MGVLQPARTAADYLDMLRNLSPPGIAFGGTEGRWDDLLEALAQELALTDASVSDVDSVTGVASGVVAETDPRIAVETIDAWEYQLGIVDDGTSTLAERQERAHAHMIATGGQSPAYFIALAAALGMTVTITRVLSTGWSCASPPCAPLYAVSARFIWIVHGPAGASLASKTAMQTLFNRLKPAHTVVYFEYT